MIIDADAHVCEPKEIFTDRLPSKWADTVPHVRYVPKLDADAWFVGDTLVQMVTSSVICRRADGWIERREEDFPAFPKTFDEQHPSSWDPDERVKIMDTFGIRAATTYPNLGLTGPDIWRTIPEADHELQIQVVSAYNDWILSWATRQPGRFIPLGCIPYWDTEAAVREIERCAEIGIKGLVMSGKPQNHGCPILADPAWEPMWTAAERAGLSISFHAAGGGVEAHWNSTRRKVMGNEAIQVYVTCAEFLESAINPVDLLLSGVLHRHPELNFAIVESGVGWVPFTLEAVDEHYKRYRPWRSRPEMREDELPSELFRRQVFVNTWYESIDDMDPTRLVVDNVMFETDYPHPTCLLGDEITEALGKMKTLSAKDREKVLWRNALRCFNLTPADVGA